MTSDEWRVTNDGSGHPGVYLVSVQGFGEREWVEADMVKAEEPKNKYNQTFK